MNMTAEVKFVVVSGSQSAQELRVKNTRDIIIGRLRGCSIRIPSASVSRKHCRLRFKNGSFCVEDLNSSNGTFLNGAQIVGVTQVDPGDKLTIGPVTFEIQYGPGAADHLPIPLSDSASGGEEESMSVKLLEALEEDANKDESTVKESDVKLEEDWHIPQDFDARDFLSQFENEEL
jgi:pSer/pThr/pTyr-binding forkhead associated (FHA) protein